MGFGVAHLWKRMKDVFLYRRVNHTGWKPEAVAVMHDSCYY